jgi:uncharacterized protein (TIRG00374 family)
MVEMDKDKIKVAAKWIFAVFVICAILYTFRGSAVPVWQQLCRTPWYVILTVCALSSGYELIEAFITYLLATMYDPEYRYSWALGNAYYCAFYRLATLGSGTGIAATYNLYRRGVGMAESLGLYSLQYAIHKITIAILSCLLFAAQFGFMYSHYGKFGWQLITGYVITVLITAGLILFCCAGWFHRLLYKLMDHINRKNDGAWNDKAINLRTECSSMEKATKELFRDRRRVITLVLVTMVKLCLWYSIPYVIIKWSGAGPASGMTLIQVLAVTTLSVMLAAVIPTPAGIGSTEFVFMMLFGEVAGSAMAGSTALIYRFATFIFPFIIGGIYTAVCRIKRTNT